MPSTQTKVRAYTGRYPRGSIAQRYFEPLATAQRDENGTIVVDIEEGDLDKLHTTTKEQWEKYASANEEIEIEDEDEMY